MLADLFRLQLDILAAHGELAASLLSDGVLQRLAPSTAKKLPVMTIPAYLASEVSMARMNRFLAKQGFLARCWGLGRNRGPRGTTWEAHLDGVIHKLSDGIDALAEETSAPVSLVGQSLGGVYARELAVRLGDRIDRVIMLGAPTFHPYKSNQHNRLVSTFAYWLNRQTATGFAGRQGLLHWEPDRPALPCVAIHSPLDGVVDENACHIPGYIVTASSQRSPRENIRVLASHIGMCVSPWVQLAVADRLLADRNHWREFDPRQYFPGYLSAVASLVYPGSEALMNGRGAAAFVEMHQ